MTARMTQTIYTDGKGLAGDGEAGSSVCGRSQAHVRPPASAGPIGPIVSGLIGSHTKYHFVEGSSARINEVSSPPPPLIKLLLTSFESWGA